MAALQRAGSSRPLAAYIDARDPDVLVLYGLGPGDALAIATLHARRWGYHRRKAIFCKRAIHVEAIGHRMLPGSWWRRSILQIDARLDGAAHCSFLAVSVSSHPERRDVQLERLRDHLAGLSAPSVLLEPDRIVPAGFRVSPALREPVAGMGAALVAEMALGAG